MRVVIAGGHGKIAQLLATRLHAAGHETVGLIRHPGHEADLESSGARPYLLDLEGASVADVADALKDADAAVFAAGAGPGSSTERKYSVDLGGSVLLADGAVQAGVPRFVQISTMGAGAAPAAGTDEVWAAYLDAKTKAEEDLRRRDLAWTILRPGALTDDAGTGEVLLTEDAGRGSVPRADVAAVLAALLETGAAVRQTLELRSGDTPVREAVLAYAPSA
jgi:nucleoside-diphosphate-sugar epimerase